MNAIGISMRNCLDPIRPDQWRPQEFQPVKRIRASNHRAPRCGYAVFLIMSEVSIMGLKRTAARASRSLAERERRKNAVFDAHAL